ncbi:MAG: biotin synthase BioB [Planctomycetia bacterium]|nr:biotin synthase BioB [Planctomycetia bacterium]
MASTQHMERCGHGPDRWNDLADRVLAGQVLAEDEALAVLRAGDHELLDLLAAAYRVRYHGFGNRMHLNVLVNAKSGMCGEDCVYCSQSKTSTADIPTYPLLSPERILDGARLAAERKAKTYCIVTSGRTPAPKDFDAIARVVPDIKRQCRLKICVSPGLVTPEQAAMLRDCGVDRVNHNLNTSRRFYPRICTTHAYQDRIDTLSAVRAAGLEICSGVLLGMGEEDRDVVDAAVLLGQLAVEALPVNFLVPIPGTPLEGARRLNPRYCLKALALFRLTNPMTELRIAGGREENLGPLQPLGLYAANSIFVGDYLTTRGQSADEDFRMIEALGFEPVLEGM